MPVLQYIDVAVGYAFAMLVAATVVGAAVSVVQKMLKTRHEMLRRGLQVLIAGLDPSLKEDADSLARELTGEARVKDGGTAAERLGREEFVLLLLRRASGPEGHPQLAQAIRTLAGKEPGDLLQAIQERLVEEETKDPGAPAYLWRVRAISGAGAGAFAGRIFAWYDNTMDRVEDRIAFHSRKWSAAVGFVVCFALSLDSIDLLRRLSRDDIFRKNLVERAIEETKSGSTAEKQDAQVKLKEVFQQADETRQLLKVKFPDGPASAIPWVLGVIISWAMVSLGAPFWLGLLNKAIGLRSELGAKLEQQRAQRNQDLNRV